MACLHLLRSELDGAIYVDTGFAYPETLALVDYAAGIVPMHVVKTDRRAQNEAEGIPSDVVPIDWTRQGQMFSAPKNVTIQSYLGCCYQNIAAPLLAKAQELRATHLYYGQRNDEGHRSPARDGDVVGGIVRRQPLEGWTAAEVLAYLATKMEVPAHYAISHSSLDCWDCTAFRRESADRIEWMREKHPDLHARYAPRAAALQQALTEAL